MTFERDRKHIARILWRLQVIWERNPHLRLAQLISNAGPDLYNVRDYDLIDKLRQLYREDQLQPQASPSGDMMSVLQARMRILSTVVDIMACDYKITDGPPDMERRDRLWTDLHDAAGLLLEADRMYRRAQDARELAGFERLNVPE